MSASTSLTRNMDEIRKKRVAIQRAKAAEERRAREERMKARIEAQVNI